MLIISLLLFYTFSSQDIVDINDTKLSSLFAKERLDIAYLSAMEDFLSHRDEDAKTKFLLITMQAYEKNWSFEQRKLIVYSYLRYCQLLSVECERIYIDIARFDIDMIEHIDTNLFAPPMIEKLILAKGKIANSVYYWSVQGDWLTAKYIIVNGKIYHANEGLKIALDLNKNRIVQVMPDYTNHNFIIGAKDLVDARPISYIDNKETKNLNIDLKPTTTRTSSYTSKLTKHKKDLWIYGVIGAGIAYLVHKNKSTKQTDNPTIHTSQN